MLVLGIETSCDETAASLVDDGSILSNVIASQMSLHARFGGIVPEIAARKHVESIIRVTEDEIMSFNSLKDGGYIQMGDELVYWKALVESE